MKTRTFFLAGICLLCCTTVLLGGEIHRAIEAGDAALVKQILAASPDALTERNDNQFFDLPIHIAAYAGNVEITRLLLEAGADIDAGDSDNSTALDIAALRRYGDLVAFLIERGANINHRDRKADCPLSFAAYGRDEAIIKQLLDAGADLFFRNPGGETLLHVAASRGLLGFTKHLLDNDAELEARNGDGATPLAYAAMGGHVEILSLFLDHGANPEPAKSGEISPLITTCWGNHVECARILLAKGAEANHVAYRNNTPIIYAAERSSPEMLRLLIDHGAIVDHINDAGETALVKAAAGGYADRVEVLLAAKADPNLGHDEGGRTALLLASLGGHLEAARLLAAGGADLNAATPGGETPVQLARYYGNGKLASMLADEGARSNGSKSIDRSLKALKHVDEGEAVIWFLGHSGWAVKTRNHLLVFDYFSEGNDPFAPALCNGHICPREIRNEKVSVFASHQHGDHYVPAIFNWKNDVSDISYFLGLQAQDSLPHVFMPPRLEESFGDLKLTTIRATDAGVGMMIEVDGLTIFHAGDHANGRTGLMDAFTGEIDWLAGKGLQPDICFMGILGCSLGQPDQVREGVYYTLKTLKPKVFCPMHAGARGHQYKAFVDEAQGPFASVQMYAPDNRGDHFVYRNGKLIDPKQAFEPQDRANGDR